MSADSSRSLAAGRDAPPIGAPLLEEPSHNGNGHVHGVGPVAARPHEVPDLAELAAVSASLESAPASAVVAWAWERYGDDLVLTVSGQDCVLLDAVVRVAHDIQVVFLDTQYHFPETLAYVEQLRDRYSLDLRIMHPAVEPDDRWRDDPDGCCQVRKIEPLTRALQGKSAWMTGLRRHDAPTRTKAPIVSYDIARGLVKVNPLATWTDVDVEGYIRDRRLPINPLREQGYTSIGCWPCTRPVSDGEHPRSGRWAGTDKIECGLHG
jgi:phosphoadenosine phosphosulfate reductase